MALQPGELPSELCIRPAPFVALTGLDVVRNAVHKAVWDSFSTNRRHDRMPIAFKVLDGDHEYPKAKQKRTSYEWYVPKGILRTNWMKKHLHSIPSLVVIFYDLDWDDPMWNEKQMECSTKVEIVRTALEGRNTKTAVVLIQKNAPLPPGEEDIAAKRASALCAACELSAKSLFVLPHTDHLFGYTVRLENAFYDLAQNYYHHEIRKVKSHQDDLNKMTHQLLYVRHQFKMGFLNELKQDNITALKHYKQAYAYLMEIRAHDTHLLEIKTMAGFLNYKMCRLSFQLNTPLDSISQFRKHVNIFKNKVGPKELSFEHSAWMAKQFSIFGDIFDEAIKLGLSAIQTQHPGFYYQQAAYHSNMRRLHCQEIYKTLKDGPTVDVDSNLAGLATLEYYGQRPWRAAIQSIEPPDGEREKEGILALQWKEITETDHSKSIIPLLSSAVTQFKNYKCPRMKRFLLVQMGEEYYNTKEYDRALTLLMHVMWDYRWERWWRLLLSIQRMALRCAYLIASVQEYATLALEVLSKWNQFSADERERMQQNLNKIIIGEPPDPEPGCPAECIEGAVIHWKNLMKQSKPLVFTVEMNNIIPFVDCQAWFTKTEFQADQRATIDVCIRSCSPFPIRFSKLSILFSNPYYNQNCIMTDEKGSSPVVKNPSETLAGDLVVEPGKSKFCSFSFLLQPEDLHRKIEISGLVLQLGEEEKQCALMHWSIGDEMAFHRPLWSPWRNLSCWKTDNDCLPLQTHARILPRESNVSLDTHHDSPALVGEFYLLSIEIRNHEPIVTTDMQLSIQLKEDNEIIQQSTHLALDEPVYHETKIDKIENIAVEDIPPNSQITKLLYMKAFDTGTRNIFLQLSYHVNILVDNQPLTCFCTKEEEIIVPSVKAFEISVKPLNMKLQPLEELKAREPFLLMMELECICPWPILLETSKVDLSPNVKSVDKVLKSQLNNVELPSRGRAVEIVCLIVEKGRDTVIPFGTYTTRWKRKADSPTIPFTDSTTSLSSYRVASASIYAEADLPAHGWTRRPLAANYAIYNHTALVQDFRLTVDSSDAFMFAGQKELHFRLMPGGMRRLTYNLYPLIAGHVALPRLRLMATENASMQAELDRVLENNFPQHIFIMPKGKSIAEINDEVDVST